MASPFQLLHQTAHFARQAILVRLKLLVEALEGRDPLFEGDDRDFSRALDLLRGPQLLVFLLKRRDTQVLLLDRHQADLIGRL